MIKKVIIILIIALILYLSATYILNIFLPKKIKALAEEFISEKLNKKIEISKINVSILKGISFENVLIYEKTQRAPYLKARKVCASLFYPGLLAGGKIIVSLHLNDIDFNLKRNEAGKFNIPLIEPESGTKKSFPLFVKKIAVDNLNIAFEDEGKNFKKNFSPLYFFADFTLFGKIKFQLTWENKISLKGNYTIQNKELSAKTLIKNIDLTEFRGLFGDFYLKKGLLNEANLDLEGKKTYRLKGNLKFSDLLLAKDDMEFGVSTLETNLNLEGKETYRLSGNLNAVDARFTKDNVKFKGDLYLAPKITLGKEAISYYLEGSLKNGGTENLPYIDKLSEIKADFKLDNETLKLLLLEAKIKDKQIIKAIGEISYRSQNLVSLEAKTNMPLNGFIGIIKEIKPLDSLLAKNKSIIDLICAEEGNIDLVANLKGDWQKKEFAYSLNYGIQSARIQAQGKIDSYPQAALELKAKVQLRLDELIRTIKEIKPFAFTYEGTGSIDLGLDLKGNLKDKNFSYNGEYKIKNANFGELKDAAISGSFTNDRLILEEGSLAWRNIPLRFNGVLENFALGKVSLNIKSDFLDLKIKANYNAEDEKMYIEEAFLKGAQTDVFSKAQIDAKDGLSFEAESQGKLSLSEFIKIAGLFGLKPDYLAKLNPQGILDIKLALAATDQLADLKIKFIGYSQNLTVYNLKSQDAKIELYKEPAGPLIGSTVATLEEGKLELRTTLDLINKKGGLNLILNEVNLAQVRERLNLKNKKMAGKLSLEVYLQNMDLGNLRNLDGSGKLLLKEGNIWEINFLKGLGEFLFIPEFEEIKFSEGYSDLVFKGESIIFENMELNSFQMNLGGAGKIYLNGNIEFALFPEFNPELVSASDGLKKVITDFFGKSGLEIEVTGTLKNPSYKVKPLFLEPFKGLKNLFDKLIK